jgi:hypothetical protein
MPRNDHAPTPIIPDLVENYGVEAVVELARAAKP